MLKRTYMTHVELGIPAEAYDALLVVKEGLESGGLVHRNPDTFRGLLGSAVDRLTNRPAFSMAVFSCGTAACISGWMQAVIATGRLDGRWMKTHIVNGYPATTLGLQNLFYVGEGQFSETRVAPWETVTPAEAAEAIGNYLTTGDPQWSRVVGGRL